MAPKKSRKASKSASNTPSSQASTATTRQDTSITNASVTPSESQVPVTADVSVMPSDLHAPVTADASVMPSDLHEAVTADASVVSSDSQVPEKRAAPTSEPEVIDLTQEIATILKEANVADFIVQKVQKGKSLSHEYSWHRS